MCSHYFHSSVTEKKKKKGDSKVSPVEYQINSRFKYYISESINFIKALPLPSLLHYVCPFLLLCKEQVVQDPL